MPVSGCPPGLAPHWSSASWVLFSVRVDDFSANQKYYLIVETV
jgi:hypothetical protein